jgi:hypothetical protein
MQKVVGSNPISRFEDPNPPGGGGSMCFTRRSKWEERADERRIEFVSDPYEREPERPEPPTRASEPEPELEVEKSREKTPAGV